MKIKEVEKEVGINARTIRFYEEMNLLQIERDPENKYREFTDENVKRLKEIKLFRSLGITMEGIRRYYHHEITLETMMNHQLEELNVQNDEMHLRSKLCEDIKNSQIPLVNYTLEQYDQVLEHRKHTSSAQKAGSLISQWSRTEFTRHHMRVRACMMFPALWIVGMLIMMLIVAIVWDSEESVGSMNIILICMVPLVASLLFCSYDYAFKAIPKSMYEFRENGIYYIDKGNKKKRYYEIRDYLKNGELDKFMNFIPYDNVEILKVWYHQIARAPITGSNAYKIDLYIHSVYDETIQIDSGMFNVSDEKIKLTLEILKEHAKTILDPFQILRHYDLNREQFQAYLDEVDKRKNHMRVYGNLDHMKHHHR